MQELEKLIVGKWMDIKEKIRDIHAVTDYLKIPTARLKRELENLAKAVEEGIIEYKKKIINIIFRSLADVKYKSLEIDVYENLIQTTTLLLYILLIQRMIAAGNLRLDKEKPLTKISAGTIEINLILKDILARIKEDPGFSKNTAVKNILVQFTIYKNENETLKKLTQNAKDKTNAFYENFKVTFEKIFSSIRKNYEEILQADLASLQKPHILKEIQTKPLASLLLNQVKELICILATLEYVANDKYKTRGILIKLHDSKGKIYGLINTEEQIYRDFSKARGSDEKLLTEICNQFNKEIALIITRQLS